MTISTSTTTTFLALGFTLAFGLMLARGPFNWPLSLLFVSHNSLNLNPPMPKTTPSQTQQYCETATSYCHRSGAGAAYHGSAPYAQQRQIKEGHEKNDSKETTLPGARPKSTAAPLPVRNVVHHEALGRSSLRKILPTLDLGRSSRNSTALGTL